MATTVTLHVDDYGTWIADHEANGGNDPATVTATLTGMERRPLISIVMALDGTTEKRVSATIKSIIHQIYPNWELWIVSNVPGDAGLLLAPAFAGLDLRIRCERPPVASPELAVNLVLAKVTGESVIFLDEDVLLPVDALYRVAQVIVDHGDARFVYADEDRIDAQGKRFAPHFKPDWNPDLFLSWDYTGALKVFNTALLRAIGGLKPGYGAARLYDVALRATERLGVGGIYHIQRILYHVQDVNAESGQAKVQSAQILEDAKLAVNDYLQRQAIHANVSESPELRGCLRVRYALPPSPPQVTLVIPTRNGLELLRRCLESIEAKTDYPNYDIIVVDNGSDEPALLTYLESLRCSGKLEVLRDDGPFNFSRLNNGAVSVARGSIIGLLNNDLEVINADWLSEMASQALRPGIGAVGAMLWYPDNTVQHAGVVMAGGMAGHVHKGLARGEKGYFGRAALVQNFGAVTAACLVVRKDIYEAVGGLDEDFAVAFNDIDFCLRLTAGGYRNLWTPYAQLYHHESASRGYEDTPEKIARFTREIEHLRQRWGNNLFHDPAYNPNLDPETKDFSLARTRAGLRTGRDSRP